MSNSNSEDGECRKCFMDHSSETSLPNGEETSLPNGEETSLPNGEETSLSNGGEKSLPNRREKSLPNRREKSLPNRGSRGCLMDHSSETCLPNGGSVEDEEVKHVSDIIGNWGPYQLRICLFLIPAYIMAIFQNLTLPFYAPKIDFWCSSPNSSHLINSCLITPNASDWDQSNKCTEFGYDMSFYRSTLIDEFNLVCDRSWLASIAQSAHQLGYGVSGITFGLLSDKFGRRMSFRSAVLLEILAGFGQAFSPNMTVFIVARFFLGAAAYGRFLNGYVLIMEWVGPKIRGHVALSLEYGFATGYLLMPLIYYQIRHFRYLQLGTTAFEIIWFIGLLFVIPESVRWQLIHGHYEEAEESLRRAASLKGKFSEVEISRKVVLLTETLKQEEMEESVVERRKQNIFDLWKIPKLLKLSLILYYLWYSQAFIFYGLVYNIGNLGGNIFVNFSIFGLSYFVSNTFVLYIMSRMGRKRLLWSLFIVEAISFTGMFAFSFNENGLWFRIGFAFFGNFCVSGAFNILYLYTAESLPTTVRQVGIGSCSVAARVGSIIAPFMKELTNATHISASFVLYGTLALISVFLIMLVPETKDRELPDTIRQTHQQFNISCVKMSSSTPKLSPNKRNDSMTQTLHENLN